MGVLRTQLKMLAPLPQSFPVKGKEVSFEADRIGLCAQSNLLRGS